MEITEVRIKLMDGDRNGNDRILAFASIVIGGCFAVRDLRLIQGRHGVFLAFPSRKLADRCGHCAEKNALTAGFCCGCGARLNENRATRDADGRSKLFADVAHPIDSSCREAIERAVFSAYLEEKRLATLPGYACRFDEIPAGAVA